MIDSPVLSSYFAVAFIGFVHGLEPGHGWLFAALLSLRRRRVLFGVVSAGVISAGHFLSSVVVVLAYYVVAGFVDFTAVVFRYLAAVVLFVLAVHFLVEKNGGDVYSGRFVDGGLSLRSLVMLALFLGFAHEEEFVLLSLAIGGINPLLLMVTYASAVTVSLVGVTLAAIKAYAIVEQKMRRIERYIPKVTGLVLLFLALMFLLGVY